MLDAPFPWFGGKRRVADVVWQRFGDVPNYVEPFFGSGAVLLQRPHKPGIETVNDKDGFVANFWRSVSADPETTALYADSPVFENDLHARHAWLVGERDSLSAKLEGDPGFYDARIAGWWAWGVSCWIGSGFCSGEGPWVVDEETRQLVNRAGARGVTRKLVNLSGSGGVTRKLIKNEPTQNSGNCPGAKGAMVRQPRQELLAWFDDLAARLRHVRVCCGDWSRVLSPAATSGIGLTGVFLDPPYDQASRAKVYRIDDSVSAAVREWAIANGRNPLLRIALCGYEGEHDMPPEWDVYEWQATGGYGLLSDGRGRENRDRERIWFSPACLQAPKQGALL